MKSQLREHGHVHRDYFAARQLILVGEQNDVGNSLTGDDKARHRKLYHKFGGDKIVDDTAKYLENYVRIVRLIGDSFPDMGMEILLHNLTNPQKRFTISRIILRVAT